MPLYRGSVENELVQLKMLETVSSIFEKTIYLSLLEDFALARIFMTASVASRT